MKVPRASKALVLFSVHRNPRLYIQDIARAANVSYSTVSRALQNSPLVGRKTTEKIQRIAQQSHYRVIAVARSLVTSKTRTIGVVVTSVSDPFVAEVVTGIEGMAESQRYAVFLANCNADPVRGARAVDSFAERRVDGIIVMASRVSTLYMPHLFEIENSDRPSQQFSPARIRLLGGDRQSFCESRRHRLFDSHGTSSELTFTLHW